jgi:hypothetical protein
MSLVPLRDRMQSPDDLRGRLQPVRTRGSSNGALAIVLVGFVASFSVAISINAQELVRPATPAIKRTVDAQPADEGDLDVWRKLNSPDAVRVEEMPLANFAEFLSKRHGIPFKLDTAGLRRAGINPDVRITAETKRIPIGTGLRQVLSTLGLTYRVVDGAVLITDRRRVDAPAKIARRVARNRPMQVVNQNRLQENIELMPQLQVELLFVKKICAPNTEQMRSIKKDLEKCLNDAAKGTIPASVDLLPATLTDCVAKHLSTEDAGRYRDEVEKRKVHEREGCVDTVITILDQQIGLSEEQRKSLVASFSANWKPAWSQLVEMAVRNGGNAVPPLPDRLIVPFLNPEQSQVWQRLPKNDEADTAFNALRIGAVGTPNEEPGDE